MSKKYLKKIAKHLEGIEGFLLVLADQVETEDLSQRLEGIEDATKSLARLSEELVEVVKTLRPDNP